MTRHQPGTRVVALHSAADGTVHLYGRGVYVGRRPRPEQIAYLDGDEGRYIIENIHRSAAHILAQPRKEFVHNGVHSGLDNYGYPLDQPLTADLIARDQLSGVITNACIEIRDEHDQPTGHVWGAQCWWTSEPDYDRRFPGWTEITAPLPDGQHGHPAPADDPTLYDTLLNRH